MSENSKDKSLVERVQLELDTLLNIFRKNPIKAAVILILIFAGSYLYFFIVPKNAYTDSYQRISNSDRSFQITSGDKSTIYIEGRGDSAKNYELHPSEYKEMEDKLKAIGTADTFTFHTKADYKKAIFYFKQFIRTKHHLYVSPASFTLKIFDNNFGTRTYIEGLSPTEVVSKLNTYRVNEFYNLKMIAYPENVIKLKPGDTFSVHWGENLN
jgi:hypothetical protein